VDAPRDGLARTGALVNVLVLGGTRFFGRTLVERLAARGDRVTVLSRGRLPPPACAEHLVADRSDPAALAAALAGRSFDAVVDNVAMTADHVRAALDAVGDRAGHYVLTSTASVYGDVARGRVWRERDVDVAELEEPPPDGHPYTIGKRGAELVLWRGERSEVPFTIVRPGYVVGPHDHLRRMQFFLWRLADGGPVLVPSASGDVFQLAWHADVAAAIARILADATTFERAYNLVGPELFTYPTLVRALASAAGTRTACIEVPRYALRRGVLATQELPFGEDGSTWACDPGRLELELGVAPTPAAEWLKALASGPVPAPPDDHGVQRAEELRIARRPIRLVRGARSRLRRRSVIG
jgi:nucleoside-diphosphate-sugar epimerase